MAILMEFLNHAAFANSLKCFATERLNWLILILDWTDNKCSEKEVIDCFFLSKKYSFLKAL